MLRIFWKIVFCMSVLTALAIPLAAGADSLKAEGVSSSEDLSLYSDITISENEYKLLVAIDNSGLSYNSARLGAAVYDASSKLIGTAFANVSHSERTKALSLPADSGAATLKLMLWETAASAKPLCKAAEYKISGASSDSYAYILEAACSGSAFSDAWEVRLLTEKEGVKAYTLTERAGEVFENKYRENLNITGTQALFGSNWHFENVGNAYRFITFKTDSEGKIASFAKADGTLAEIPAGSIYKSNNQSIGGKFLEAGTVIFNIDAVNPDSTFTTDISILVGGGMYEGYVFENSNGGCAAVIVTSDGGLFTDEAGFAIVTDVRLSTEDGENIVTVHYLQDEKEGIAIFNDDSYTIDGTKYIAAEDLAVGDVFVFNVNAGGFVNKYAVLAQIDAHGLLEVYDEALAKFSDYNQFYYGYISNSNKFRMSKGEVLDITAGSASAAEIMVLDGVPGKYTYSSDGLGNTVVNGDFMGSYNTDYFDDYDRSATMVFVRLVYDDVKDIYSFDERVYIDDSGKAYTVTGVPVSTKCVNCKSGSVTVFSSGEAAEKVQ